MKYLAPAVTVRNLEATFRFYRDVLGCDEWFRWEDPSGQLAAAGVKRGEVRIILDQARDPDAELGPRPGAGITLYMVVSDEDIDALYEQVKDRATVISPIADKPWGDRVFTVADPDGYRISVARES